MSRLTFKIRALLSFVVLCSVLFSNTILAMPEDSASSKETTPELQFPSLVEHIYLQNDSQPLWLDFELAAQLHMQLDILRLSDFSPFFNEQVDRLQEYYENGELTSFDWLATDTLLLYISYVKGISKHGKSWLFNSPLEGSLPRPSTTEVKNLLEAIETGRLSDYVQALAPPMMSEKGFDDVYIDLLAKTQFEPEPYQQVGIKKAGENLTPSDRATLVARLAISDVYLAMPLRLISYYDDDLQNAIERFQALHGLDVDGIIGPDTVKWLNVTTEQRLKMLALNAERSRLWPKQRDALVVVNVPSFELIYWQGGEAIFESKVVVGRTSRKTPLLETNMDSLILNPTWNVPWKIMVKDILPKAKVNPMYIFSQQFEVIESWKKKDPIDPTLIDWKSVEPKEFPYRLRQQAGDKNALGRYKFNTPNRRAIFLHDTPSKHLFESRNRAFSSGCIRVQNADVFAKVLLDSLGQDTQEELMEREEPDLPNTAIALKQRIPVHIIYQTVWLQDGQAHFRDDVYNYDFDDFTQE